MIGGRWGDDPGELALWTFLAFVWALAVLNVLGQMIRLGF